MGNIYDKIEEFFNMKKATGAIEEIYEKKEEWFIHTMGTKTHQLLSNLTSPDDPKKQI